MRLSPLFLIHFLYTSLTPHAFLPRLSYDSECLLWNLILWYQGLRFVFISLKQWGDKNEQQEKGYIILRVGDVPFLCAKTGVSRSACTNTQPSFTTRLMRAQIEIQSSSVSLVKQQLHVKWVTRQYSAHTHGQIRRQMLIWLFIPNVTGI